MFSSVLVANRGEIAVRIVRTLRRLGIRSVVVASIPDRRSLAVRRADAVVLLEGFSAAETYLDMDAVLAAAKAEGCEAIHPGYGFLSERAEFAERCAAEGIVFVGPPPSVLRGMGDKSAARQLAVTNGVPVVPGWDGEDDEATLVRESARIGYPIMIKARGGGGGRGMREVFAPGEMPGAIESARSEALSAFGDGGLLLEKLLTGAHHVEVQVLADGHGNVIHLGERECSVQRRHQKLIEETPSPVVDDELRKRLTGAALRLADAIEYVNAGTFEFLVGAPDESGLRPFYFLEVNPRLQVEHPVTEAVTGLDLVELQLRVAAGERLPIAQGDVVARGHAIESRINAEDPRDGFRPSTGRIRSIGEGSSRFDTGFGAGDAIPSQYDSLIAKAVVHASSREEALVAAEKEMGQISVEGVQTNVPLQRAILGSAAFKAGEATVDWLESSLAELLEASLVPEAAWTAAAAVLSGTQGKGAPSPFSGSGWLGAGSGAVWLSSGGETRLVAVGDVRGDSGGSSYRVTSQRAGQFTVTAGNPKLEFGVRRCSGGDAVEVSEIAPGARGSWRFAVVAPPALPRRPQAATSGA
ncbi:MAG: biotin carboxylase N-terminal domain-containing protein, partial [Tepidiformaceae bacterium]